MTVTVTPRALRLVGLAACSLVAACAPQADAVAPDATPTALAARQTEWSAARQLLAALRATEPTRPYVAELSVALRERVSGHGFGARGALAVDPHRSLRLILLGPGGATALDLWLTPTRFRLVVPSMDLVRRGGTDGASTVGLPIAFFRWWFLEPVGGRLLDAHVSDTERELYVRGVDGSTVLLRNKSTLAHPEPFVAVRRAPHDIPRWLEWSGRTLRPQQGDVVHYREDHATFGLDVHVRVDALGQAAPDPEAFTDPDQPRTEVSL